MNCFELVRQVLDDQYGSVDEPRNDRITAAMNHLTQQYRDLTIAHSIDYHDPATRFAYIHTYTTAHAIATYNVIKACTQLQTLLAQDKVAVSCIGGGPGSDLLGVLRFLDERALQPRLTFDIVDRERLWSDCWHDVFDQLENCQIPINAQFHPIDVCNETTWEPTEKHFDADLLTMVFFFSEIFWCRQDAEPYLRHCLARVGPGACILFIDNNKWDFYSYFDTLIADYGYETLLSHQEPSMRLPVEEEKQALGEYYELRHPKTTLNVAYRVWRKLES